MKRWAWCGVGAGVVLLGSTFMPFPEITSAMLDRPDDSIGDALSDDAAVLYIRNGLSWICVALLTVYVAGLARHLRAASPADSLVPWVLLVGGAVTGGALFVGYGMLAQLAGAASEGRSPALLASTYTVADGLGYGAWTAIGLVTAPVAVAGLRGWNVSRALGVFSAVVSGVLLLLAFFPFFSWMVAAIWLIVSGIAFVRSSGQSESDRSTL